MAEIFFSYSRSEKDFVTALIDELAKRDRSVWCDIEGIEPSEKWLKAIFRAIEEAESFALIVTPESVISRFCRLEVAHARESGPCCQSNPCDV